MTNNKSIEQIIEKRLMEYAYTVTGYMGDKDSTGGPQEIKSDCIPKAIIKKVACLFLNTKNRLLFKKNRHLK